MSSQEKMFPTTFFVLHNFMIKLLRGFGITREILIVNSHTFLKRNKRNFYFKRTESKCRYKYCKFQ